jgi:hypothetical protein
MALVITKKVRATLLVFLGVILVGGGGFLIWTVTNQESLAPEDSEAAPAGDIGPKSSLTCDGIFVDLGYTVNPCNTLARYGHWVCGTNCMSSTIKCSCLNNEDYCTPTFRDIVCPDTRSFSIEQDNIVEGIYRVKGLIGRGHSISQNQTNEIFSLSINGGRIGDKVISTNLNTEQIYQETGGDYWEGVGSLGDFMLLEGSNAVTMSHEYTCTGTPTAESVHLYQLCLEQVNICQSGTVIKPDENEPYDYGTLENPILDIQISDPDGVGEVFAYVNDSAKANPIPSCGSVDGATCYLVPQGNMAIQIFLAPGVQEIPADQYNIDISWKDGAGIGGSNCSVQSTFTISGEVINPECSARAHEYQYNETEWSPSEVGFCKVGSTANPSYDVLSNSFPEPGETVSWVCENDQGSVSCEASRLDIDDASCGTLVGNYPSTTTDWPDGTFCSSGSLEPSDPEPSFPSLGGETSWVCSNQDKQVTCNATRDDANDASCGTLVGNYSAETVEWPSGSFCSIGDPEPASPAFPSQGGQTTWVCTNEGDSASCVATRDSTKGEPVVPQTGVFDTVLGRVSVGVSFIFLGGLVTQYSRINYFFNSISERNQFKKEIKNQRRKEKMMSKRRGKLEDRFKSK